MSKNRTKETSEKEGWAYIKGTYEENDFIYFETVKGINVLSLDIIHK